MKHISIILVAIIFGFIAFITFFIFEKLFVTSETHLLESFFGAFVGAFFAFLFIRLGDALTRIYERKARNHNALIKLDHYFNDTLNIIGDNLFIADDFINTFSDNKLNGHNLPIYANRFHQIPIEKQSVIDITNLKFANELLTYNIELRKLNESLSTINRSYELFSSAFIDQKININVYIQNVKNERHKIIEVRKFIDETKEDAIRLLATSRILAKSAPPLIMLIKYLSRTQYKEPFEELLNNELNKLNEEINENAEASGKRIRKIHAKK